MKPASNCFGMMEQRAFTLLEVLVSLGLISLILAMAVGSAIGLHREYFSDIVRTRVNGNLRGAMDIVSMNIRQAGENVSSTFPAVTLTNGTSGSSDVLTLRRSLVTDVLTLCTAVSSGTQTLSISSASTTNPECMAANIAASYNVFNTYRTDNGGSIRVYLYNQTTKTGEFLDYTAGGLSAGQYYLTTSSVATTYPALTSNIYMLEEYKFQRDTVNNNLDVYVDGRSTVARTVAFSVIGLDVVLKMSDGTSLTSLGATDAKDWKDIEKIRITLSGEESYRGVKYPSSISGEYFPRNVLSYEG